MKAVRRDRAAADAYWASRLAVPIPANVSIGEGSRLVADEITLRAVFARCRSRRSPAIVIGEGCILDGVAFNLHQDAFVRIGDGCQLIECFLIAAGEIEIGDNVTIGWHATVVDSDFHPVAPAEREQDVRALSPLGDGIRRFPAPSRPVRIGHGAWIGPLATILKGVTIGDGAVIEPGAVITHDVAAGARMIGNPARTVGRDA